MQRKQKAAAGQRTLDPQTILVGDAVQATGDNQATHDGAAPIASDSGHGSRDHQRRFAASLASPKAATDQRSPDRHADHVGFAAPLASAVDRTVNATQPTGVDSLAPIVQEIRAWHRDRVFAMESRKSDDLRLGAHLRRALGWSRLLPKSQSDTIKKRAHELMALGQAVADAESHERVSRKIPAKLASKRSAAWADPDFARYGLTIMASIQSRAPWDAIEENATKEMERLAKSLPVWAEFGQGVKGFGARSLAVIVGEAGDLSLYANPAKLWKRMGLAVMDGVRQGGLRATASKEDWIAHGYNAKRRSFMFVIGDCLVKNQNPYRDVYLQRKEFERAKAVANGLKVVPAAKIPEKRKDEFMSVGHIHRRAQRYMEKRLLKHLWQAWRRACTVPQPSTDVPAADSERQTKHDLEPREHVSASRSAKQFATSNVASPSASIPAKAGKRRATACSESKMSLPAAQASGPTP